MDLGRDDQLWIDGYNVILGLAMAPERSLEQRRDQLVRRCAALARRCWVVFDSRERPLPSETHARHGRVRVEFARDGRSADEVILRRLERTKDARTCVLVTDDRELAGRARARGARSLGVAAFGAELLPRPRARAKKRKHSERPLGKREVEEWMRYFGFDEKGP